MSDEKIVSLKDFRQAKENEEGQELHEQGEAFKFEIFEIDDGELPNGVGINDSDHPISVLLDKEELTGICMTPETALRLGQDLIDAAKEWKLENTPKEGA